ncbi:TIR domain-containing protein [Azotobacter sp. CWF10]
MDTPRPEEPTRGSISQLLARLLRAYRKPTVFISYRRVDTLIYAEKIHKRLEAELGKSNVFFDKKDIDLGVNFSRVIEQRVASCQVLLVLVGPDWLDPPDENGVRHRRLEDPNDYVRLEIEEGLKREHTCRVIPVLVHGARMPKADELPPAIAELSGRNFHRVDEALLEETLENLVKSILRVEVSLPELQRTEHFRRSAIPLILCAVLAVLTAGWVNLFDVAGGGMDARFVNVAMRLADSIATFPSSDKVVLIGINDDTELRFGKTFDKSWRREHATLIRTLADRGASVVVFDLFLDEPSDYDSELVSAVSEARRKGTAVVFGTSRWPPEMKTFEAAGMGFGLLCIGGRKLFGYATFAALAVMKQSQEVVNYLPSIALMAFASGAPIKKIDFRDNRILMLDPLGKFRQSSFRHTSKREIHF